MTQKQAAQLARAIEIATRDALQVVPGKARKTGEPVYLVASRSQANHFYALHISGGRIRCQCPAHQNGRVCAHAAAVRQHIERERQAEAERQAERDAWALANMGGALLDCYRGW